MSSGESVSQNRDGDEDEYEDNGDWTFDAVLIALRKTEDCRVDFIKRLQPLDPNASVALFDKKIDLWWGRRFRVVISPTVIVTFIGSQVDRIFSALNEEFFTYLSEKIPYYAGAQDSDCE
jgi:hypothetical protein